MGLNFTQAPSKAWETTKHWLFHGNDSDNNPTWTSEISKRGVVYEFPYEEDWGWYFWIPSVA